MGARDHEEAVVTTRLSRWTRLLAPALAVAVMVVASACGATSSPAPADGGAAPSSALAALPLEVPVAEAYRLRESGALVLDVRQPDEWASGHIPGATLIPLDQLPNRLGELPRDQSIVVVCRSGNRSAQGRDVLLGAGFTSVTSMAGGMTDWIAASLPVTTEG